MDPALYVGIGARSELKGVPGVTDFSLNDFAALGIVLPKLSTSQSEYGSEAPTTKPKAHARCTVLLLAGGHAPERLRTLNSVVPRLEADSRVTCCLRAFGVPVEGSKAPRCRDFETEISVHSDGDRCSVSWIS